MPPKGPVSVLVYHPDEAQAYARLVRAPRGQVRLRVASTPETAMPFVEEMDVLYTWGFPAELLPLARRLRWVQVMGAGVNAFLDVPFPPKVVLTRVEGVFGPWMAEYVFGWLLWASQRTEVLRAGQRLRRWEPINPVLLRGKTLGIVGVGSIGRVIASIGHAFQMRVLGLSRTGRRIPECDRVYRRPAFHEFLAASDYVVLVAPLTPETRGMLGEPELHAMRPGVLAGEPRPGLAHPGAGPGPGPPGALDRRRGAGRLLGGAAPDGAPVLGDAQRGGDAAHLGSEPPGGDRPDLQREPAAVPRRPAARGRVDIRRGY